MEIDINFRIIIISVFLVIFPFTTSAQSLTQTISGSVIDVETKTPLVYANVIILGTNPVIGRVTDENGNFKITNVPIGRHSLKISYLGYEEQFIYDVLLSSGKELVLNIQLQEKFYTKDEIIVYGNNEKARTLSNIALVSARTFSVEESNRFAGGFNDLSRMVTAFAGVSSLNGETNEIVIRGNSPRGLLWRIEGIEVSNPNHFPRGDGSSGGGISIITSDIISNSDFFTGAFPSEYGNAISGVFDLNLREGNKDNHEFALKLGAIGVEAAAEGPLGQNNNNSYLINYRYSTLSMLENIGFNLVDNTITPTFQDIAFNFKLQTNKFGAFTVFGLGGISNAGEKAIKDSSLWYYPSDWREEFELHQTAAIGIKNMYVFPNHKTYLHSVTLLNIEQNSIYQDSLNNNYETDRIYDENINYDYLRFSIKLNHKFNIKNTLRIGYIHSIMGFNLSANQINELGKLTPFIENNGQTNLSQAYINWKHRLNEKTTLNAGFHSQYFLLNKEITIEPRLGIRWNFVENQAISYGFGLHSQTEPVSLYYTKFYDEFGDYSYSNKSLKLAKSIHNVIAYDFSFNRNHRLKIEVFHQYLYDIPIDVDTNSTYSTLNNRGGLITSELNNKGNGYNYGIEFTLERFLHKDFYFLTTLSLFDSKYIAPNGLTYNTLYNSNFLFNCLGGKEFKIGKNNIFGINTKLFYKKGSRITPINLELSKLTGQTVYIYENTYKERTPDFIRWDLGIHFRQNKEKYSIVFSLDIQNILDRKNIYTEYYNSESMEIEYRYALPIIPVFNLKFEF